MTLCAKRFVAIFINKGFVLLRIMKWWYYEMTSLDYTQIYPHKDENISMIIIRKQELF